MARKIVRDKQFYTTSQGIELCKVEKKERGAKLTFLDTDHCGWEVVDGSMFFGVPVWA